MPNGDNKCDRCGQWSGPGHTCPTGNAEATGGTDTLTAAPDDTAGEDTPDIAWSVGSLETLETHRSTLAKQVTDGLAQLEDGKHRLNLQGADFVLYVDDEQAHADVGYAVHGQVKTTYDLRRVTGPDALMDSRPVARATSGPYATADRRTAMTSTHARSEIANALVGDVVRTPPSRDASALAQAWSRRRGARAWRERSLDAMEDAQLDSPEWVEAERDLAVATKVLTRLEEEIAELEGR